MRHYSAPVYGTPGSYGVIFSELPGCTSRRATLIEVARNAGRALSFHVERMAGADERIPEPSNFDAPLPDWLTSEEGEAVAEPVRFQTPRRGAWAGPDVNISADEGRVACIEATAAWPALPFSSRQPARRSSPRKRIPERLPTARMAAWNYTPSSFAGNDVWSRHLSPSLRRPAGTATVWSA